MTRRSFVLLGALMLLASFTGTALASHLKEQPRRHKVVYHLSEAGVDKARFVLGNIQNTITGVGGPAHIEAIELVVHGPALKTFVTAGMDPQLTALPRGAHHLPQGGVVRIMELVEQGYVYLRP
jgi:intracellular sulfur oxidation DsrE/DsrF family protein